MLQTIILLALLFGAFILGLWLTFFGHRAFRFSGAIFGFGIGVTSVLFAAAKLNIGYSSMIVLVGTPVIGFILGMLGAFVPIAGAGLGGVGMGFFYGVGLVFTADTLTNGAIESNLYTFICVVLIAVAFILCLIWNDAARWLTTAFTGSYAAVYSAMLAFIWFMSGGFSSVDPLLSGSFLDKFSGLNSLLSANQKMILLAAAFVVGILGCVIQIHSRHKRNDYPLSDEGEEKEDDLFPLDSEDQPVDKRKGLFGKRNEAAFDDEPNLLDDFDDAQSKPKRDRRRRKQQEALLDDDSAANELIDEEVPVRHRNRSTAALEQTQPSQQVQQIQQTQPVEPPDPLHDSLEKTQVFRRVSVANAEPKSAKAENPAVQPARQPQVQTPAPSKSAAEQRLAQTPSFTPRAQRRRGN